MSEKMTAKEFQATKPKGRNQKKEESLQIQIATYLKLKHPSLIFRSDIAAGIKMTVGQAVRAKKMQSGRAYPDLFIARANSLFHGMFLELKKSREGIFLKDGQLSTNAHIQEQEAEMKRLRKEGYYARFACGFDDAINQIENYLKR